MIDETLNVISQALFEQSENLLDLADSTEECLKKLERAAGGLLPEELAQFRDEGCAAITKVIERSYRPFDQLEAVFKDSGISCMTKAVADLEQEILKKAGFEGVSASGHVAEFLKEMVDGNKLDSLEYLEPIQDIHEKLQEAKEDLEKVRDYLCNPAEAIVECARRKTRIVTMVKLLRDAGFMSADLAAICSAGWEPSGLLFFTSAKSVITSSMRIAGTLREFNEPVDEPIDQEIADEASEPVRRRTDAEIEAEVKKSRAVNREKIKLGKHKLPKKIDGF